MLEFLDRNREAVISRPDRRCGGESGIPQGIWNFQKAKGLPTITHLDPATLAALDVLASAVASPSLTPPTNFGA